MEQTLVAVTDTKDHLYTTNKSIEKAMDTLKSQLHEEVTARKLAEQRIESMKSQIDELRKKKVRSLQGHLAKFNIIRICSGLVLQLLYVELLFVGLEHTIPSSCYGTGWGFWWTSVASPVLEMITLYRNLV